MSSVPKLLPADWDKILDNVSASLAGAIAAIDAQAESAPARWETSASETRGQTLTELAERLRGLEQRTAAARDLVQAVDDALQDGVDLLTRHQSAVSGVRQKLAEAVGRAVG